MDQETMSRAAREGGVDPITERGNVLLVEFVNADQFPGRINPLQPLAAGVFSKIGCATRWVRFAVSTTNLMTHGRDEITLAPDELDFLLGVAAEHRPALVIITDALFGPQERRLRDLVPEAEIHVVGANRQIPHLVRVFTRGMLAGATPFGGVESEGDDYPLLEAACLTEAPTAYFFEPGNAVAATKRHDNIYLLTSGGCGHRLNAWDNPHYRAAGDAAEGKHLGCSFCLSGRHGRQSVADLAGILEHEGPSTEALLHRKELAWIRSQLRALAAERGVPERFPNAVLLERVFSAAMLKEVLDCMEEFGLAGHVQLLIASRTDRIEQLELLLQDHQRRFPESKAGLGVYSSGVESFGQEDLDRFNKGTTTLDGLRAVNTLRRLALRMPGRFWYDGISFILFTPWTTLASLYLTVGLARLLEIGRKEAGNIFQARMRLHEELPITRLARFEGLTEEEEPDPAVVMNRRKLFSSEQAWRFADPRVRPICRLVLRFDLLAIEPRDEISEALYRKLKEINPDWTPGHDLDLLDLILRMIEAAQLEQAPLDETTLLDRASTLHEENLQARAPGRRRYRFGEERLTLRDLLARVGPLVRSGKKPLLFVPGVDRADLPAPDAEQGLLFEMAGDGLFVAADRETLQRGRELASREDGAAIEESGLLHGVPPCCARAFATSSAARSSRLEWEAFSRRLEEPGPVSALAQASWAPCLSFVPCSPTCSAAIETRRSWYELTGSGPQEHDDGIHIVELPFEGDGDLVRLPLFERHGDTTISYDPGAIPQGEGKLRARLARGDELRILPGQIQVFREGELVDFLPPWCLPWSLQRPIHAAEYREAAKGVALLEERRPRKDKRLLLLEFVTHERWVFDSRHFPFVKGGAEDLGWATLWLCAGGTLKVESSGSAEDPSYEQYMDLAPMETERIRRLVAEFGPTHVLTSHPPSPSIVEALRGQGIPPDILCTSDMGAPGSIASLQGGYLEVVAELRGEREASPRDRAMLEKLGGSLRSWRMGRTDWVLSWLGVSDEETNDYGKYIVGTFRPSYEVVMANDGAVEFRPHLLVLGGVVCDHFQKVAADPRYAGIDLFGCEHVTGCAYCTWYRGPNSDMHVHPVVLAEQQLRSISEKVWSTSRYRGVIDILDIRLFTRIDRFARMVLRSGLPPTTFHFEPRVDRLIQVAPRLEEALELLAPAGHAISLFRMGAENLVEEENQRFNKNVDVDLLGEGTRTLQELAARFPKAFFYDPTWGYITCSPWTTLEMLETTIERAIASGFEPLGVWLYTPLLLFRTAPITRLAESQGLVEDRFDDLSLLWEPSINGCPAETIRPWRFQDPATAVAFALIVRFCAAALRGKYPDSLFDGDRLYARLLAEEGRCGPYSRPDLFARQVIATVRGAPSIDDREALLLDALARYLSLPDQEKIPKGTTPPSSEGPAHQPAIDEARREEEPGYAEPAPVEPAPRRVSGPMQVWRGEMERLLHGLRRHLDGSLGRLEILEVREDETEHLLRVSIELDGRELRLRLQEPSPGISGFVKTPHFVVSYDSDTPLQTSEEMRRIERLARLIEGAAVRHVPKALPPGRDPTLG